MDKQTSYALAKMCIQDKIVEMLRGHMATKLTMIFSLCMCTTQTEQKRTVQRSTNRFKQTTNRIKQTTKKLNRKHSIWVHGENMLNL